MSYRFVDSLRAGSGRNVGFIIRIYNDARSPERQTIFLDDKAISGQPTYFNNASL